MKRLLACLALCATLSASAQDDNCTVLGVQELSSLYSELSMSIDTIVSALSEISNAAQSSSNQEWTEVDYIYTRDKQHVHGNLSSNGCYTQYPTEQEFFSPAEQIIVSRLAQGWTLREHEWDGEFLSYYTTWNCQSWSSTSYGYRKIKMMFSR